MAKKPKQPAKKRVYITASYLRTSAGPAHHGDYVDLPESEAIELKKKGFAQ